MYKSKGEKNMSIQLVKDYFLRNKVASKNELAKATHLSLATITNILKELQDVHYIERIDDSPSTGGRKAKRYIICGQYMLFGLISLEVNNNQIKLSFRIIDLNYSILYNQVFTYDVLLVETLIKKIKELKKLYHFLYISISVPGIVKNGYLTQCDIEELEKHNLITEIESEIDVQVGIENDVNTAMLGYVYSHNMNEDSLAFIYQPDNHYSGCSLYINDSIVYGATHFAGELGYLPYSHLQKQKELLKDNPLELLVKQVVSVIAIINPSQMIIYSVCVNEDNLVKEINQYIPTKHLPALKFIDSMDTYIFKGLMSQCIEISRYKKRRE